MNTYTHFPVGIQHHAQLIIGSREWALSCIIPQYHLSGVDVIHHTYHRMSIVDVRALIHEALFRPIEQPTRVFVIEVDGLPTEAQNALLKLFEEPNEHSVFYLIVHRAHSLLPTLRSRLHLLAIEGQPLPSDVFKIFLTLSLQERLSEVTRRLKKEDFEWVEHIVRGAIVYARTSRDASSMRVVQNVDAYIRTTGASRKMLLEHLALSL